MLKNAYRKYYSAAKEMHENLPWLFLSLVSAGSCIESHDMQGQLPKAHKKTVMPIYEIKLGNVVH